MATNVKYINIGEIHKDDVYYRYKMPQLETTIEGRGNGIKTKIYNIEDIASALDRPSKMIMKYFSIYLGTSVSKGNIIRGEHMVQDLNRLLNKFIEDYVLCQECNNPETIMKVKHNDLKLICKACGYKHKVNESKVEQITKTIKITIN
jgi:translation initiation factor 5